MAVCGNYRGNSVYYDFTLLLMKKTIYIVTLIALLTITTTDAQCAMCRAVLESDPDGAAAEGINNGILYLMAFPYLMVGVIGYFVYKSRQKSKREEMES